MSINQEVESFLEHFGTRGMKWGVRKSTTSSSNKKIDREASKDAKEFARAKMFYGEGAGTRRKLIKASVEAKSKRDSTYKKAFDHHLEKQDLSTHASKATKERTRTDRKDRTKKQVGFFARKFTGEMGTQAAFAAVAVAGIAFLSSSKGRAIMSNTTSRLRNTTSNVINNRAQNRGADYLSDYFKRNS